ncbi:MAG: DUF2239 family protein [Spirochaetales bacterium]|nr:DUF2239 family protein [Spirochaetales bacterium]
METNKDFSAFAGCNLIVTGDLQAVLTRTKDYLDSEGQDQILIFKNATGRQVDYNMQGTLEDVLSRVLPELPQKGPGRPRLGVVCKEISLLPRHWEWLKDQPHGASGTLRRLVDAARKKDGNGNLTRQLLEAAGNFMWAMAGNFEGFEEASRALYAKKWDRLDELISPWPDDVKKHLLWMVQRVRDNEPSGI